MRFDEYTAEERRAAGHRGGVNSGRSRRARRAAIEEQKARDAAIQEMRLENITMIHEATKLLMETKRALDLV